MNGGGAEREGDTESEAGSSLWAISTEPNVWLEPTNYEVMTWAEVRRLTNWATQAPLTALCSMPCFPQAYLLSVTLQRCCDATDYIPYAVPFIPVVESILEPHACTGYFLNSEFFVMLTTTLKSSYPDFLQIRTQKSNGMCPLSHSY